MNKKCDQCEAVVINGVFCHETGCPNTKKQWDGEQWIAVYVCDICGYDVPEGESCSCYDETEAD